MEKIKADAGYRPARERMIVENRQASRMASILLRTHKLTFDEVTDVVYKAFFTEDI